LLLLTGLRAFAQKAEPLRIEFEPGASAATVSGELSGRQQMEYAVAARSGQRLTFRLVVSPAGGLSLKVRDPDGAEIALRSPARQRWTALASRSGDYEISVLRAGNRPGSSTFKLTVTIR
jgi:hypothetical protein